MEHNSFSDGENIFEVSLSFSKKPATGLYRHELSSIRGPFKYFLPSNNSMRICKYYCPFLTRGFVAAFVNTNIRSSYHLKDVITHRLKHYNLLV
jgi:hypothetical protein